MSQTLIYLGLLGWFISIAVSYVVLVRNLDGKEKPGYLQAIRMNIVREIRKRNGIGIAASFFQLYFLYLFLAGVGSILLDNILKSGANDGVICLMIALLPLAIGAFAIGQVVK
jgi:hypothetical protein